MAALDGSTRSGASIASPVPSAAESSASIEMRVAERAAEARSAASARAAQLASNTSAAATSVIETMRDLGRRRDRRDRHDDSARIGDREPGDDDGLAVAGGERDPVARSDAALGQHRRAATRARVELRVGDLDTRPPAVGRALDDGDALGRRQRGTAEKIARDRVRHAVSSGPIHIEVDPIGQWSEPDTWSSTKARRTRGRSAAETSA
jgi:hypothetical protein